MTICPPEHPHRSGCYQRHKCKCDKCRAYVAWLRRSWAAKKRATDDSVEFEPWQLAIAQKVFGADK